MAAADHNRGIPTQVIPVIKDHHWDNLARGLASGKISRREAVRLLGSALVGGVLASIPGVALAQPGGDGGNSACVQFCTQMFPSGPERARCISQGAQGSGPCACNDPQFPGCHPDQVFDPIADPGECCITCTEDAVKCTDAGGDLCVVTENVCREVGTITPGFCVEEGTIVQCSDGFECCL